MTSPAWRELAASVREHESSAALSGAGLLEEPVARYFSAALPGSSPDRAGAATLRMKGQIKIGRWLPFRARQLLAPRLGTVWEARVAGVILGSDRYVDGSGGMDWNLLGIIPLVHAEGADVSRSAAERAAGESIWVPGAVSPLAGTRWTAVSESVIAGDVDTDGHTVRVEHHIDSVGRLVSSSFQRWGDPDNTGSWKPQVFGVDVEQHRRFGDVCIPVRGVAGWHHGTDRWSEGKFFRFEITGYELVSE